MDEIEAFISYELSVQYIVLSISIGLPGPMGKQANEDNVFDLNVCLPF